MAIEIKNTTVKMIKPLYLGMSILYISKTLMYEFKYGYIGPKYGDKAKLCYTDGFIINIKGTLMQVWKSLFMFVLI